MNKVHQGVSLLIITFAAWVGYEAWQLTFMTRIGPGPGFFPFWLALIMGGLSAAWFVQLMLKPVEGKAAEFLPDRAGCWRVIALIVAVAIFGVIVEKVGFSLSMFGFLIFLLWALGRRSWTITLSISVLGSFGIYYLFKHHLKVTLPESSLGFLRALGF